MSVENPIVISTQVIESGVENQWLGIGTDVGTVGAGFDQFITNVVLSRVWAMVWLKWSQSLPQ